MKISGLPFDADQIAPDETGKFSPMLFSWLKSHGKKSGADVFRTVEDSGNPFDLGQTIVLGNQDEDKWVYGTKLATIVTRCPLTRFAWPQKFENISDLFWNEYLKVGRCLWDAQHDIGMIGDENRFSDPVGYKKTCNWCGTVMHRHVKVIQKYSWKTSPQAEGEIDAEV